MRHYNFEALTDEEIVLDAKDYDNEEALVIFDQQVPQLR